MESLNNSVIICDSPCPTTNSGTGSCIVTNYRKRLRSSNAPRTLVGTPYESPLSHFKRNFKPTIDETALNLKDRSRALLEKPYQSPLIHFKRKIKPTNDSTNKTSNVSVITEPLSKKLKNSLSPAGSRRWSEMDESVVIVGDVQSNSSIEQTTTNGEESDWVEVLERSTTETTTKSVSQRTPMTEVDKKGKSPVKRGKVLKKKKEKAVKPKTGPKKNRRSKKSQESTNESSTFNDENHNRQIMESQTNESEVATAEDVEEIEVVWSSKPNVETASEGITTVRKKITPQMPIIVDNTPSLTNMWLSAVGNNLARLATSYGNNGYRQMSNGNGIMSNLPPVQRNPTQGNPSQGRLREIVVDGSNVAMGHTRNKSFSEKGLQIVLDYFKSRGHAVKVFLPQTARNRSRELIEKWHTEGIVVFTPSRKIAGRMITSYDDRYILEYATQCDGIVVSSDQYRDLWQEKPQWRNTIENRLLTPTFVGDYLMFPEDPLGRSGPKLEDFLKY